MWVCHGAGIEIRDSEQESVFSSYCVGLKGIELKLSGLVAKPSLTELSCQFGSFFFRNMV